MKRFLTGFTYALLIIALMTDIAMTGYFIISIQKLEKEKEEFLRKEELRIAEETMRREAQEQEEEPEPVDENSCLVIVNRLPVYEGTVISENTDKDPIAVLENGEKVSRKEEGDPYSLIVFGENREGYVWSDCIRAENMCDEFTATRNVVVIDAGHQAVQNLDREPVGPGAEETKAKVAQGTEGVSSKVPEADLDLRISLLLEKELTNMGYNVVMVRRTNEVDISNKERAMLANNIEADVFVRIHADGSENADSSGAMTICCTKESPYDVANYYEDSRKLADCILEAYTQATGLNKRQVLESDTYSGINWCTVPVTIVEMGFMTNPEEDIKMQDASFQNKMAEGLAAGIDNYFKTVVAYEE